MSQWVNYQQIRETVRFEQVLHDYGVQLKVQGNQGTAFCPLPGHKERSQKKSRSFSANLGRGIFQCFGCQAKGNVIDFAALMEGLDPADGNEFRKAALLLQERYLDNGAAQQVSEASDKPPAKGQDVTNEQKNAGKVRVINAPLDFQLKSIDSSHPYLQERGLTAETLAQFGLGYCSKGLMKGRVVIPLHDMCGQLIGYAGRLVEDSQVSDEHPKYLFPGERCKDEIIYEFRKGDFLFNGFRQQGPLESLIIVEGFFGAIWLHQCGHRNVVALMGSTCTRRQGELVVELTGSNAAVYVMPDGDSAGEKCAVSVFSEVGERRAVRWIRLKAGAQPDSLSAASLELLLQPAELGVRQ